MNSAIAHTYLYNIIIIFLLIVFAFVMGMVVYYKSFKINKNMLSIIEKYEGYNTLAKRDIDSSLSTIGYSLEAGECPERNNADIIYAGENNMYCVYHYPIEKENGRYYTYGITTYITFDFPLGFDVRLPIHTKSNRIFKFSDGQNPPRTVE
jgi:hypothetical protein